METSWSWIWVHFYVIYHHRNAFHPLLLARWFRTLTLHVPQLSTLILLPKAEGIRLAVKLSPSRWKHLCSVSTSPSLTRPPVTSDFSAELTFLLERKNKDYVRFEGIGTRVAWFPLLFLSPPSLRSLSKVKVLTRAEFWSFTLLKPDLSPPSPFYHSFTFLDFFLFFAFSITLSTFLLYFSPSSSCQSDNGNEVQILRHLWYPC